MREKKTAATIRVVKRANEGCTEILEPRDHCITLKK